MFYKFKRIFSVALVLVLVFSLAGCSKPVDDGSSVEWIVEEEIITVGGSSSDEESTVSTDNTQQQSNNQSTLENSSTTETNNGINLEKLRGTTVKFAGTSYFDHKESGPVVEAFEEKYGINVEVVLVDGGDYPNQIAGLIAAGQSPDCTRSNGDFPACMGFLQSLDAAKIDYNDPIWDQNMFELTTFGDSPYLCNTVGNVYAETDIVVYRKDILQRASCRTPEEYDKQGKWTWDAFFDIARQCKSSVDGVEGCAFASADNALHMAGGAVFKLENGKFVSGINDKTASIMTKFAEAWKEGIISWHSTDGIVNGTTAIITVHSYALRKSGAFENDDWTNLGFYTLPNFDENTPATPTGIFRGWGIIRGAENPVGAGLFLRYYLDSSNYDTANTYISPEAETFFFKVTSFDYGEWNPYFTYLAHSEKIAGIDYSADIYNAMYNDPNQVSVKMSSIRSYVEMGCENLNDYIEKNIGLQ
ncbi:MAG: extracellular solute-binding protein [Clostridia bacterium]|nr:extracellular solute-binding protein [Clostridia bacterium]